MENYKLIQYAALKLIKRLLNSYYMLWKCTTEILQDLMNQYWHLIFFLLFLSSPILNTRYYFYYVYSSLYLRLINLHIRQMEPGDNSKMPCLQGVFWSLSYHRYYITIYPTKLSCIWKPRTSAELYFLGKWVLIQIIKWQLNFSERCCSGDFYVAMKIS